MYAGDAKWVCGSGQIESSAAKNCLQKLGSQCILVLMVIKGKSASDPGWDSLRAHLVTWTVTKRFESVSSILISQP
jgi:hypothetical protein